MSADPQSAETEAVEQGAPDDEASQKAGKMFGGARLRLFASARDSVDNIEIEDEPVAASEEMDDFDEDRVETRRRIRRLVLTLGVLLVFAGISVYSFLGGGSSKPVKVADLPVVEAVAQPVKERPESEGGLEVPYQDKLVLNDTAEPSNVERLLPPAETPKPPAPATPQADAVMAPEMPAVEAPAAPVVEAPVAPVAEAPAAPAAEAPAAPTAQAPAAPTAQAPAAPTAQAPAAPAAEAPVAPSAPATEQLAESAAPVIRSEPAVASEPAPAATQAVAKPASAEPARPVAAAATAPQSSSNSGSAQVAQIASGDYVLQLSSLRSADGAESAWTRIQRNHPDLLGDMSLFVQSAEVNGTTYYRVQTGPFPSRATALDMCAQLKAEGQDCLVKKR